MRTPTAMNLRPLLLSAVLAGLGLLLSCGGGSYDPAEDARVLTQLLTQICPEGGTNFSVVYPETLLVMTDRSEGNLASIADRLRNATGIPSYNARPLLDELLKRNKRSSDLGLDAWPGANFVVDRQGKYTKYLVSGNAGDWKRMYSDHPEVKSVIHAAHPVYDRENGIVFAYIQEMTLSGAGNGSIYVLDYADGSVEEMGRVVVWSP